MEKHEAEAVKEVLLVIIWAAVIIAFTVALITVAVNVTTVVDHYFPGKSCEHVKDIKN